MFPQDSTTPDHTTVRFSYLIVNIHWISTCDSWEPYSALTSPMTMGDSLSPLDPSFFMKKMRELDPSCFVCVLMLWLTFKNRKIPTLMTCTLDQSSMLANLCLASSFYSWATFIFFTWPILLFLEGPLASFLYAHSTDDVVYGHSSIHLIQWTFLARTLRVSALAASAWSCCSDPACLSIFKDLRSS